VTGLSDPAAMSLPEANQWVLREGGDLLQFAWVEAGAAALIDLALAGRITTLHNRGFFDQEDQRRVLVTDRTPLGVPELDRALELLSAQSRPRRIKKWIWQIGREVSDIVRAEMVDAGLAEEVGQKFPSSQGNLRVLDDSRQRMAVDMLNQADLAPTAVTDPRAGALVDLLRNGGPAFRSDRERPLTTNIVHEWYPPETRPTIDGVLYALQVRTASGGIY